MKKIFVLIFTIALFFVSSQGKTFAADLSVSCQSSSGCVITGENPLFSNGLDGVWYPGRILTKTINVENSGLEEKQIRLKTTETSGNELGNIMHVELTKATNDSIWQGSLRDFFGQEISLGTFNPGENKDYFLEFIMEASADNSYQNQETVFDLTIGFWEEEIAQGGDQNSAGSVSLAGDSASSDASNIGIGVVLSDYAQNIFGKFLNVNAKSKEQNKELRGVLGNGFASQCSCIFWQFLSGVLLMLLLLLTAFIFRKKIKQRILSLRRKN